MYPVGSESGGLIFLCNGTDNVTCTFHTRIAAKSQSWNQCKRVPCAKTQKIPPGAQQIRVTYKLGVASAHCFFSSGSGSQVPPTTVLCRFLDTLKKFPGSRECLIPSDGIRCRIFYSYTRNRDVISTINTIMGLYLQHTQSLSYIDYKRDYEVNRSHT